MKQHGHGGWSGHHDITRAAVLKLYQRLGAADGTIQGWTETQYAEAVNEWQAYQDRVTGPTTHSAYRSPAVQREHFMADPFRRGDDNLRTNAAYVFEQLAAAHQNADLELKHLGAAVHALQDSYSGAHAWREDSVYDGDPHAPVQSLQVFTPLHVVGIEDGKNTHADEFDQPPTSSGSARAAVEATYRLLCAYELNREEPLGQAVTAHREALGPILRPSSAAVTVNLRPTPEWAAERDRRLALERASAQARSELERLGAVLSPNPVPGLRATPDAASGAASRPATSASRGNPREGVGRDG
jgi:hypothetical protein